MTSEEMERAIQFLLEQQAQLTAKVGSLSDKVDGLTGAVDGLTGAVDGLTSVVVGLSGVVERNTGGITALLAIAEIQSGEIKDLTEAVRIIDERTRRTDERLDERTRRTDERLDTLINIVERYISEGRGGRP